MKKNLLISAMLLLSSFLFATEHQVNIQGFAFSPATLTIEVGDTVVWTNADGANHTASSTAVPNGAATFDSGTLGTGNSFSFKFTTAGEYAYQCNIHTGMKAAISVTEPLGIVDLNFSKIEIYPNPVVEKSIVEGVSVNSKYFIYSIEGGLIAEGLGNVVSWESITPGVYFVKIAENGEEIKTFKVVKD